MSRNGGFAEYLVAPEKCLVPIPDNITFEQAAVATDSVTTAVHALMERLDVQEGDPVLIMGVGGLGSNGIQIAKHMGAKVIAADIDDEKLAMAKDLGADYVFNTTKVDPVSYTHLDVYKRQGLHRVQREDLRPGHERDSGKGRSAGREDRGSGR